MSGHKQILQPEKFVPNDPVGKFILVLHVLVNALFNVRLELIFEPVCEKITKLLYVNGNSVWFLK